MFTTRGKQDQNQGNGGSNYTEITDQKLNPGDCKMNLSMELKGNQVNQNEEENVVVIGRGKETIGYEDTKNLKNAVRITIEDGVKEIDDFVFLGFHNLKEINLPGSIQEIGEYAFHGCESIEKVGLRDGIKEIYFGIFRDCRNLKRISVPGSVEKIGEYAFM